MRSRAVPEADAADLSRSQCTGPPCSVRQVCDVFATRCTQEQLSVLQCVLIRDPAHVHPLLDDLLQPLPRLLDSASQRRRGQGSEGQRKNSARCAESGPDTSDGWVYSGRRGQTQPRRPHTAAHVLRVHEYPWNTARARAAGQHCAAAFHLGTAPVQRGVRGPVRICLVHTSASGTV